MMATYTEQLLGITSDDRGARILANKTFTQLKAKEFILGPRERWNSEYLVHDCKFENCTIKPGAFYILGGVELRNVIFDNMRADDGMTIWTDCLLNNVTIRGGEKSAALWVKPNESEDEESDDDKKMRRHLSTKMDGVETMLDISQFFGEVEEILGLPVDKVKIDRDRHFVLSQAMKKKFKNSGLLENDYWESLFMRLEIFEVDSGIFDIPRRSKDKDKYEAFCEFKRLAL